MTISSDDEITSTGPSKNKNKKPSKPAKKPSKPAKKIGHVQDTLDSNVKKSTAPKTPSVGKTWDTVLSDCPCSITGGANCPDCKLTVDGTGEKAVLKCHCGSERTLHGGRSQNAKVHWKTRRHSLRLVITIIS